jgi:general secretion pathway protein C
MLSRFAAFVIWAAVAASIVFWALRLGTRPLAVPAHTQLVSAASGVDADLSRLFGSDAPAVPPSAAMAPAVQADARFRLVGVVAARTPAAAAEGLALIATDGKPAKAYRVGTAVDGEMVLLAVHARGASLGPRGQPAQVALELPALPPPASGTLPGAAAPPALPRPAIAPMPRVMPTLPPKMAPPQMPLPTQDASESEAQPDPVERPLALPPPGAARPPA